MIINTLFYQAYKAQPLATNAFKNTFLTIE